MKRKVFGSILVALLVAAGCDGQRPDPKSALRVASVRTFSSFDPPTPGEKLTPARAIKFEQAELAQVLNLYAETSGRSIIRGANVPEVKITFSNQTPMSAVELLQTLDTVLAAQGVTMVVLGTQCVKAVSANEAHLEAGPVIELEPGQLPDSSSFLIYIVKLKNVNGSQVPHALQPFAKMANSIVMIPSGRSTTAAAKAALPNLPASLFGSQDDILILRDYSSNVRRMLQVLEKMEER
jgi:type II secretory pathway component GspD/PulD (secretin)